MYFDGFCIIISNKLIKFKYKMKQREEWKDKRMFIPEIVWQRKKKREK